MNKTYAAVAIVVIVIIALFASLYQMRSMKMQTNTNTPSASQNFGSYNYECDEHVKFSFTSDDNMNTIRIAPMNGAAYPPASTLAAASSTSGVRYEGNGLIFTGKGESVTIGDSTSTLNCSPISIPDEAPFNFGD